MSEIETLTAERAFRIGDVETARQIWSELADEADRDKAIRGFGRAADLALSQGESHLAFRLARMFITGYFEDGWDGIPNQPDNFPINEEAAYGWFQLAAQLGHEGASEWLSSLSGKSTKQALWAMAGRFNDTVGELDYPWLRALALSQDVDACVGLHYLFSDLSIYCDPRARLLEEWLTWYLAARELGNAHEPINIDPIEYGGGWEDHLANPLDWVSKLSQSDNLLLAHHYSGKEEPEHTKAYALLTVALDYEKRYDVERRTGTERFRRISDTFWMLERILDDDERGVAKDLAKQISKQYRPGDEQIPGLPLK